MLLCCWLQFKRQLLKEEAALRIYDKATDGEAAMAPFESVDQLACSTSDGC